MLKQRRPKNFLGVWTQGSSMDEMGTRHSGQYLRELAGNFASLNKLGPASGLSPVMGATWKYKSWTLQRISHLCIPRKGIARPQSQFQHSCVCERFFIIPGSVHIFSCSRIGRPIVGIHKSLTDTWMWNLRLRPRNFFSRNICFKFSVFSLCRV